MNSQALRIFREVPGVNGVFLVNDRGELLLRDVPSFIPPAMIEQAGCRLSTFFAAAAESTPGAEEALMRCALQSLYLRKAGASYLGVLCQQGAQLTAIRFAANIFVKQAQESRPLPPENHTDPRRQPPQTSTPQKKPTTRTGIWG